MPIKKKHMSRERIVYKRILRLTCCWLIAGLALAKPALAADCQDELPTIRIGEEQSSIELSHELARFIDTGTHKPEFLARSSRWCANEDKIWSFGEDARLRWFGVRLTNTTQMPVERVFALDAPFHRDAELHVIGGHGTWGVEHATGDATRVATFNRDQLGYPLTIEAGATVTLLLSVDGGKAFIGARLQDLPEYLETVTTRNLFIALIIGAIFCMLLFQTLLATTSGEHLPLTFLVVAVFAYEFVRLGYSFVAFGASDLSLVPYVTQLKLLVLIASISLTSAYFELRRYNPKLQTFFYIACSALTVLLVTSLFDGNFMAGSMHNMMLMPAVLMTATAIYRLRESTIAVSAFAAAWSPTFIGYAISASVISGTLAYNPVLLIAGDAGITLSLLAFIMLISHRLERRRRDQEDDLRQTQRRYQLALEGSNDGIFEWDLRNGLILASQRAHEIAGREYVSGWQSEKVWLNVIPESEVQRISRMREAMFVTRDLIRVETHCYNEVGNKVCLLLQGKLDFDDNGKPIRIIGSISDVSEQKGLEKRLRHDALHDFLTGLPNRTLLVDRIGRVVERLKRNPDARSALLFIDLDNFKAINDNLGHGFGDQVLVALGERLMEFVRSSDTVARLGGDEFVILLEDMFSHREAEKFANRILQKVHTPVEIRGHHLVPSVSIGMTLVEDPNVSVEMVLGDADIAMYAAKERGKGRVVAFETTMRTRAAKRLEIESALRQAMENEELYLAYQPIFAIQTDEPTAVGVEALLRWNRSDREDIAPSELLTLAEENGMIEDIGKWVIQTATRQLSEWRTQGYPDDFYININLSSVHFENEEIVSIILNELDPLGIPRNSLRIEIVETAVIQHPERALSVIKLLRSQGILVSIDDFGTGFSSLSYLHRFPFYALKIDRSFVLELAESKATRDIVTAIVMMARRLGIKVVAEGIENQPQLEFLKSVGCELAQGFLLARPAVSESVDQFFMIPYNAEAKLPPARTLSRPLADAELFTDATA